MAYALQRHDFLLFASSSPASLYRKRKRTLALFGLPRNPCLEGRQPSNRQRRWLKKGKKGEEETKYSPKALSWAFFLFSFLSVPCLSWQLRKRKKKYRLDRCFQNAIKMAYTRGEILVRALSFHLTVKLSPRLTYRGNSISWFLRWRRRQRTSHGVVVAVG